VISIEKKHKKVRKITQKKKEGKKRQKAKHIILSFFMLNSNKILISREK